MNSSRIEAFSDVAQGLYLLVALLWFVPDRRIEGVLARE
jgi:hypothetical protein